MVVGGGIAGWATAAALIRRDASRRVVMVDDSRTGRASAAGAGIATPFTILDRGPDWTHLMYSAMGAYAELLPRLERAGIETGHQQVGELIVAVTADEAAGLGEVLARMEREIARYGTTGIGAPRSIEGAEAARRHPLLTPVTGALLLPEVAQVDGRTLCRALATWAQGLGVQHVTGSAELLERDGRIRGVRVGDDEILADGVVLATGAWTESILEPLKLTAGTYPQRGQLVHAQSHLTGTLPLVTGYGSTYVLCFDGGRIVFGPTREDDSGFEEWPTIAGLTELVDRARAMAPGIEGTRWLEIRSGLRPMSRDDVPTIGSYGPDGPEGLVLATGLGAQGLTVGPHVGSIAARLIDGEAVDLPAAFSPRRWTVTA